MLLFVPRSEAFADAQADRVCRDYLSSKGYILFFCSYVGLLQWIFSIVYDRGLFEKWQLVVLFQQNNNKSKLPLLLIIFLFQSLSMLISSFKLKSVCIKKISLFSSVIYCFKHLSPAFFVAFVSIHGLKAKRKIEIDGGNAVVVGGEQRALVASVAESVERG